MILHLKLTLTKDRIKKKMIGFLHFPFGSISFFSIVQEFFEFPISPTSELVNALRRAAIFRMRAVRLDRLRSDAEIHSHRMTCAVRSARSDLLASTFFLRLRFIERGGDIEGVSGAERRFVEIVRTTRNPSRK